MTIDEAIEKIEDLVKIQSSPGNYDYDPYMQGLGNGLIVALAVLKENEPVFLMAPKIWGKDKL